MNNVLCVACSAMIERLKKRVTLCCMPRIAYKVGIRPLSPKENEQFLQYPDSNDKIPTFVGQHNKVVCDRFDPLINVET
jgi:hypothetical protein